MVLFGPQLNALRDVSQRKVGIKLANLIQAKTTWEDDAYDEHHTGVGVRCVPACLTPEERLGDFEIVVPEYYFMKLLEEGKVGELRGYIVAQFPYNPFVGAIFNEERPCKPTK